MPPQNLKIAQTPTNELTSRVFAFICQYMEEHGHSPTQREIASACYISQPAVIQHLDRLEAHGYIARESGRHRGIQLLKRCPS